MEDIWKTLERAKGGSEEAWWILNDKYRPQLIGLAYSITQSRMAAEDVAQESFAVLLSKSPQAQGDSLMPYLATIAYRLALKESRRRRSLIELSAVQFSTSSDSISDKLEMEDRAKSIAKVLEKLSPEHRAVIALRFQGEMSYEEIGAALELPLGTVKSRLFNAVKNCRKLLGKMELNDDTSERR